MPVLERAIRWVRKAAHDGFQVQLELPEAMPVTGSAGQVQQVLMNLVQNAHDATLGEPVARLEVRGRMDDATAVLEFRDNGPGIDPENLPRIFDPFFTMKPVGRGTGLGLAISYGAVQRHGGELSATNHPQKGAVFTLRLPSAR